MYNGCICFNQSLCLGQGIHPTLPSVTLLKDYIYEVLGTEEN